MHSMTEKGCRGKAMLSDGEYHCTLKYIRALYDWHIYLHCYWLDTLKHYNGKIMVVSKITWTENIISNHNHDDRLIWWFIYVFMFIYYLYNFFFSRLVLYFPSLKKLVEDLCQFLLQCAMPKSDTWPGGVSIDSLSGMDSAGSCDSVLSSNSGFVSMMPFIHFFEHLWFLFINVPMFLWTS